jgi:hypothetical protein
LEVIAMKLTRKVVALGVFAAAAISAGACSSQQGTSGSQGTGSDIGTLGSNGGNTGTVGLHLNIPNSTFTVSSLNWTISNGTNSYSGTINMTDDAGNAAQSIEFVAGPVVAGTGYTVTLSGSDSNGDPCTGTSPQFNVTAGTSMTATAVVNVTCTVATDAALSADVNSGSVAVDAGVQVVNQAPFQCPGISGVSISPAELKPPESAALAAGVVAGSGGVQTLLWSATCQSGTPIIVNPTSPNATFQCGTAVPTGGVDDCTLTLTIGLDGNGADGGNVGPVCTGIANTTISETIACEPGGVTLPSCGAGQTQCGSAEAGTDCEDLSNGSGPNHLCGTTCAGATVCGGTTPACVNGVCTAQPPTACTTAPCASTGPNSLTCTGNNNSGSNAGVCTPMEAAFRNFDPTGTCYSCMVGGGCFDAPHAPAVECGDLGAFTDGAGTALTAAQSQQDCMNVVSCILGSGTAAAGGTCASNGAGVAWCYCDEASTTCASAAPSSLTGACTNQEVVGFSYNSTSSTPVSQQILSEQTGATTQPSGSATGAFACAILNGCTSCY